MKINSNSNSPEFKRGLTEEEINSPEFNPDDFAPAPEKSGAHSTNEQLENKRNALAFAFVAALFALILGLVGWGTSSAVSYYQSHSIEKQVLSMFPNCDRIEEYNIADEEYEVFAVFFKQRMAGYCVKGSAKGFGGTIKLLVAFDSDNKIKDIKITDHNESMGLGSKISGNEFLSQFTGLLVGNVNAEYDLIAGATTSSKAVGEAIKSILDLNLSTNSIANELGYETITQEEIEEEVKKEEENKKDPSDKNDDAETTDDKGGNLGEFQGGANVNQGDGDLNMDGEDETTVYETETKKPDDDETTDAETTDKAEETTAAEDTTKVPDETTNSVDSETAEDTTTPVEDTTAPEDTTAAETTAPIEDTTVAIPEDTTVAPAAEINN